MLQRKPAARAALVLLLLVFALWAPPAAAQSLDALRASGAVGERYDGYAEARQSSAAATVQQVNAKRQQIYKKRAAEQGISAAQVGRIYAREIMGKAPSGTFFLNENGSWTRKP